MFTRRLRRSSMLPQNVASPETPMDADRNAQELRLLVLINKGHVHTHLHQVSMRDVNSDKEMFDLLRKEYYTKRRLLRWLSCRDVKRVCLAKVG
jgi:hypothetical protein